MGNVERNRAFADKGWVYYCIRWVLRDTGRWWENDIGVTPISFDRSRINTFITKMIKNKLCEENIKTTLWNRINYKNILKKKKM